MRRHLIALAAPLVLLSGTSILHAQAAPLAIASSQLDINDGGMKDAETYFIPAVNLYISHHGGLFVANGKASAKTKFVLDGLDNEYAQGLSRQIQEDLATKLRAAGLKVLLYEDMKADPEVVKRDRLEADKKLGIATKEGPGGAITYVLATGTAEQAFKPAMQGPAWPFRGFAKDKKMMVLLPELWVDAPQMLAEKSRGYKSSKASIDVEPGMLLRGFFVWTLMTKGGGWIKLKQPVWDLGTEVGTVTKEGEDRTDLGLGMKRAKGDYSLVLNKDAFTASTLRAGYAMNDAIVAAVVGARK